mgnify:CR=1 FL=1
MYQYPDLDAIPSFSDNSVDGCVVSVVTISFD